MKDLRLVVLACLLALGSSATAAAQNCATIVGQNTFVADVLDSFYLWYGELPLTNPANYDSPEQYLEAVRFRPIDDSFSYITEKAASDAFFSNSQFIGIGYSQSFFDDDLRVVQVFPDSPASEAGLVRGATILAINGRPVAELVETGELNSELGPSEIGYVVEMTFRVPNREPTTASVTKRPVTIPPVSHTAVIDMDGTLVGYLHFRNFVEPSFAALDAAFADFQAQGVREIIVDLRYNGGGLVLVAQHFAGLIGGATTQTKIFNEYVHNDKQTSRNQQLRFDNPPGSMSATRVVVITGRGTASASELIINGLRPFMPVTLVGDATFGKPVGQYGFEFCDKMFFPVSFHSVNAVGEGEYYGGFPADCPMHDGIDHALGDPEEARLKEALHVLRTGSCSQEPDAQTLRGTGAFRHLSAGTGLKGIINAW